MSHPRLSGEEIERRGQALYEQAIRPKVEAGNEGKICMIDVETGDYEIGESMLETSNRLLARHPDAALWAVRIGYDVVYSFDGGIGWIGEPGLPESTSPNDRNKARLL